MVTQPLSGLTTGSHGTYVIAYSINAMSPVTAVLQPISAGGAVAMLARRLLSFPSVIGTAVANQAGALLSSTLPLEPGGRADPQSESSSQIALLWDGLAETLFVRTADRTSNADSGARAESSTADSQDIRRTEGELARLLEVVVAYREEMALLDAALTAFTSTRGPAGLVDIAVAADRGQLPELDLIDVMKTVSNWREPEFIKIVGWFIGRFLTHPSAAVRSGALAALIQLEDSSTVSNLERAREAERDPYLRRGMSRGMDYLRAINARAVT